MTRIDPIQWTEKTALRERDQLRTAVNMLIESINGTAGDADRAEQAAVEARTQAEASARSASEALEAATAAAGDASKVNQFNERIAACVNHLSVTGTADSVTIGYATDGKPSPLTVVDIPVLSGMGAGVVTPAQMADITDQLDSLGRGQDDIKRDFLKRNDVHNEQDISGRVNFKISPYTATVKSHEYPDRGGLRAVNVVSACAIAGRTMTYGQGAANPKWIKDAEILGYAACRTMNDTMYKNLVNISARYCSLSCCDYSAIEYMSFKNVVLLEGYAFVNATKLKRLDMDTPTIPIACFNNTALDTLVLRAHDMTVLNYTATIDDTPIGKGAGYIYVPDDLVAAYKVAPNWVDFADRIKGISELPPAPAEASA